MYGVCFIIDSRRVRCRQIIAESQLIDYMLQQLAKSADARPLSAVIMSPNHVFSSRLLEKRSNTNGLRTMAHGHNMPQKDKTSVPEYCVRTFLVDLLNIIAVVWE